MNEQAANTLCTSASSPNALSASANIIYWVNYPWPSTFLPADSSNSPTFNTIYLGWAGNVISAANTLMNGVQTGEAPELSCSVPSNTQLCSASTTATGFTSGNYAEYDNGNTVFGSGSIAGYWNFNGTSTPGGATVYTSSGNVVTDNGLSVFGAYNTLPYQNGVYLTSPSSVPSIADAYGTFTTSTSGDSYAWNNYGFSSCVTCTFPSQPFSPGTYFLTDFENGVNGQAEDTPVSLSWSGSLAVAGNYLPALGQSTLLNFILTTNSFYNYQNYNPATYGSYATSMSGVVPEPFVIASGNNEAAYAPKGSFTYWVRYRAYPPNDILPGMTAGNVIAVPPTVTISPASNTVANQGQYESFNGVITGGATPYNVFLYVASSASPGTIVYSTNAIFTGPAWSFDGIQISGNWATDSPLIANVILTDANSASANSVYISITINQASSSSSPSGGSSSPPTITLGDNLTVGLTSNISVITAFIVNQQNNNLISKATYNQNQLPTTITLQNQQGVVFNFACQFKAGNLTYYSTGTVYGMGSGQCGQNYTLYSGTRTVLYLRQQPAQFQPTSNLSLTISNTTVTLIGQKSSDPIIILLNGTTVQADTGNIIYNTTSLPPGIYTIQGKDLNTGNLTQAITFTKPKFIPVLQFIKTCGNFVSSSGKSCITTVQISSKNNQLSATLYLNGRTVGSTTNTINDTESLPGFYQYLFATAGNQDYVNGSMSYSYTITRSASGTTNPSPANSATVNTTGIPTTTQSNSTHLPLMIGLAAIIIAAALIVAHYISNRTNKGKKTSQRA